eukprot:5173884-Prymnesium_polylepis.1
MRRVHMSRGRRGGKKHESPEPTPSPTRERWWNRDTAASSISEAPGTSHSEADAAFFGGGPSQDEMVLDVLSDEQMAEIETAWFTIDADRSGYL